MHLNGTYYGSKKKDYDSALQNCIEEAGDYILKRLPAISPDFVFPELDSQAVPLTNQDVDSTTTNQGSGQGTTATYEPLMLLGKVQSGKTKAFCGLIALSFDNDVDIIFVLTKNDSMLTDQTVARLRDEFSKFTLGQIVDVVDIMKLPQRSRLSTRKMIVVCKKEKNNLRKLLDFVKNYNIPQTKRSLLIDDEADSSSVGFDTDTDSNIPELRTIASAIDSLIVTANRCPWVQVTATPYALFLQPDFTLKSKILPKRPAHCVLVPHGAAYVGGVDYFINSRYANDPNYFLTFPFSSTESDLVTSNNRNSNHTTGLDVNTFLENVTDMPVFKQGIITFIMGTILMHEWYEKETRYSYLIHTAQQTDMHSDLRDLASGFIEQIKDRNTTNSTKRMAIIDLLIQNSYDDLSLSVQAHGKTMLPFVDMKSKFFAYVDTDMCSFTVVNSKDASNNNNDLIDKNGELNRQTPCSIFIGGQKLDRGLTIPKMLGFYYGRNPQVMQQDTVIQHSRMFGYRQDFMPVTRFYATVDALEKLADMTEADESLRDKIASGNAGNIFFIPVNNDGVVPASASKVGSFSSQIVPKKRILPVGLNPTGAHSQVTPQIEAIFNSATKLVGYKYSYRMNAKQARDLIDLSYKSIEKDPDSHRYIEKAEFFTIYDKLENGQATDIFVALKRGKNTAKYRDVAKIQAAIANGTFNPKDLRYMDAPDNGQQELAEARELSISSPALIMLEHTGTAYGWNNTPFWWPILLVQENFNYYLYASQKAIDAKPSSKL